MATSNELRDLMQKLLESNEATKNEVKAALSENKTALTKEIRDLKGDFFREITEIKQENRQLKEENKLLKEKLEQVDKDSRKCRLIFYGLSEKEDETLDVQSCLDLIKNKLQINCRFSDIKNYQRFGKEATDKPRPASLEVNSYFLKREILKNSKKLQGSKIYVTQEYTQQEYEDQKLLRVHLKKAREDQKKAYIKGKTLYIDNDKYTICNVLKFR